MRFVNQTFANESIALDGNEFSDCTFRDCTFTYTGGALPRLSHNAFSNSRFVFMDAAERTLILLGAMYAGGFAPVIEETLKKIRAGDAGARSDAKAN